MRVGLGARVVVAEPDFAGLWHIPDPATQADRLAQLERMRARAAERIAA